MAKGLRVSELVRAELATHDPREVATDPAGAQSEATQAVMGSLVKVREGFVPRSGVGDNERALGVVADRLGVSA